jgi:coenzyme PQQ synthesis protein D (PqqD)
MSRLTIPEHVMVRRLGDECVILDMANGTYFGLDAIGSRIWQLLSETGSSVEIGEQLAREYEISPQQAAVDLARLIEELAANGLVTVE